MTENPADRAPIGPDQPEPERAAIRRLAHDLNNVMTTIQGYAEILLEDLEAGDSHRHDVELLHQASRRASAIVRDMMLISR